MTESTRTPAGATAPLTPLDLTYDNVRAARELAVDVLRAIIAPDADVSNVTVVQLARVVLKSSAHPDTVFPGVAKLISLIEMLDRMQGLPEPVAYPDDYERQAHAKLQLRESERAKRFVPRIVE